MTIGPEAVRFNKAYRFNIPKVMTEKEIAEQNRTDNLLKIPEGKEDPLVRQQREEAEKSNAQNQATPELAAGADGEIINQTEANDRPMRIYGDVELLSQSTCTREQLTNYLAVNADTEAASVYRETGKWPSDVQIPKSAASLTPEGKIDWSKAPKGGYVLKANGEPSRTEFVPPPGAIIDRYGPENGRFTSPVVDGVVYSYDQRALPYMEDPAQYHQYKVMGDLSQLEQYVKNCGDPELIREVDTYILKWYNGKYDNIKIYSGSIAPVEEWGNGGGIQYELPFPIDWLISLGYLEEYK